MEHTAEHQCPGCGTTFVGHSGFAPTSGTFPSKNATSCPAHAAAPELLKALEESAYELHKMAYPITNDHALDFKDCHARACFNAQAAIKAAKGDA